MPLFLKRTGLFLCMDNNSLSLMVGGEVKAVGLAVGGKLFVFTPVQQQFLLNLQKMKNVTASALSVGKEEEWGQKFLKSVKFRKYLSLKMKSFSDRNSLDVEWWYAFGKKVADGYEDYYEAHCGACGFDFEMDLYEVESVRGDDMTIAAECPSCMAVQVTVTMKREEFKPTREQVEGWKELGQRLIPKIERVHHQFENVDIVFESEEDKHG